MDILEVRAEVERLAPWYFRFDLPGISTAELPPVDGTGHREIKFPDVRPGFWRGASVLDVGCAEGAWSFGALERGAASVTAFDCRDSHIEKARFISRVRGLSGVEFEVGSCDRWFDEHPGARYDVITFCGIIYHLPDPASTVARYCAAARRAILVTSPLWGGEDIGYTQWSEADNAAASEDSLDSLCPNNLQTITEEFRPHGFVPTHLQETGHSTFAGGCGVFFERTSVPAVVIQSEDGEISAHCGITDGELSVTVYNHGSKRWCGQGQLRISGDNGGEILATDPEPVELPGRICGPRPGSSTSRDFRFPIELREGVRVQLDIRSGARGGIQREFLLPPVTSADAG